MKLITAVPTAAPWFYRVLLTVIVPFALVRLWWRGRKQPGYRAHIAERFGFINVPAGDPIIWLHAVSVGETRAAEPLVRALLAQYPGHRVLLTHMTPTGRATSTMLFPDPRVLIAYVPYDLTGAVDRFLTRVQPSVGLLMETEIWPNLILRSRHRHIPVLLINARLSARSAKRYARFAQLIRPVLSALSAVGAQTPEDADRLCTLGVKDIAVTGNLKFDIRIDQSGRYFFIDTNTNPAFGPKELEVAISNILDLYGITFQEILKRLMLNTMHDAQGEERISPDEDSQNP